MQLYVRLKGPEIALRRHRRDYSKFFCPRRKSWSPLSILTIMFLSIAVTSVGFFISMEVPMKLTQKEQRMERLRGALVDNEVPPISVAKGDFFKTQPLLNASAPNVEVSTQIILNRLYTTYNRNDILNYYNSVRCRETKNPASCRNFTLVSKTGHRTRWHALKPCKLYPDNLKGKSIVWSNRLLSIDRIDKDVLREIKPGGWWEPRECLSGHSVAIILPYKDRWTHLTTLLNYLHPLLQRQQIRYKIFVVEQYNNETFNKGVLMNAGFIEALKEEMFHCFIFHDVDLIPENDYNMYSCPEMPRHLSVSVNEFNYYTLPYYVLVGGAFAIRTEHFFRVNGYSNLYWGWGAEDDDMGLRIKQSGLKITRPLSTLGRYTMIKHVKRKKKSDYKIRVKLLSTARKRYRLDGLNSVQYKLINKKEYPWYTTILVDVGRPHPMIALARGFNSPTTPSVAKSLLKEMFSYKTFEGYYGFI